MSREKTLMKNTIILAVGNFLPKLVSVVTLPIITACLSKSEYGTYDLVTTMVSLLIPVSTLQIQSAAFRFLIECRGNDEESSRVISNVFLMSAMVGAVASIILSFFLRNLGLSIAMAIGLYFFADSLNISISQIVRGLSYNKLYSVGSIVSSVVNGLGIILFVRYMSTGLFGVIVSMILANIASVFIQSTKIKLGYYIKLKYFSFGTLRNMLSYSWPMVPNNLSNWVLSLSDRLVITAFLGIEANATYAVANKIPNLLSIAQSVFVMAWQENASISVNDEDADKYFSKMFDSIFSLVVGFTALLIAFTPIMFEILIKGDYDDAYYQMPLLFMGMFFYCMSAFQGGIYIAHKKTISVGITTMGAAVINLLIDLCFVNVIGITAGSLSTLIAYLCLYIFRLHNVLKFQKINYNIKKQVGLLALVVVMLVLCFMRTLWCDVVNIILGITLFMVLNKDLVHSMLKSCRNYLNKYKAH